MQSHTWQKSTLVATLLLQYTLPELNLVAAVQPLATQLSKRSRLDLLLLFIASMKEKKYLLKEVHLLNL